MSLRLLHADVIQAVLTGLDWRSVAALAATRSEGLLWFMACYETALAGAHAKLISVLGPGSRTRLCSVIPSAAAAALVEKGADDDVERVLRLSTHTGAGCPYYMGDVLLCALPTSSGRRLSLEVEFALSARPSFSKLAAASPFLRNVISIESDGEEDRVQDADIASTPLAPLLRLRRRLQLWVGHAAARKLALDPALEK